MNRFLSFMAAIAVGFLLAYVIMSFHGCGPSPYPTCTAAQANAQRCDEGGEYVAVCDGKNWLPQMYCGETYDSRGEHLEEVCVEGEGGPSCQSIK